MILCIRTDQPSAYISLYDQEKLVTKHEWDAYRTLSDSLLEEIEKLLRAQSQDVQSLSGVVVYQGPGSFTGLRIGITVANSLADSLSIPVVGVSGEAWQKDGLESLTDKVNHMLISPEYGGEAHITKPRK